MCTFTSNPSVMDIDMIGNRDNGYGHGKRHTPKGLRDGYDRRDFDTFDLKLL